MLYSYRVILLILKEPDSFQLCIFHIISRYYMWTNIFTKFVSFSHYVLP